MSAEEVIRDGLAQRQRAAQAIDLASDRVSPTSNANHSLRAANVQNLTEFFQLYAPSKLSNVAAIVAKYDGKEAQLFTFLQKKYAAEIAALEFRSPHFDAASALIPAAEQQAPSQHFQ